MRQNDKIQVPSNMDLKDPAWYKAATLSERARLPRSLVGDAHTSQCNSGLAEKRLANWLSEPAFAGEEPRLAERLESDGLTIRGLRRLLGEPADSLYERHAGPPAWLIQLYQDFSESPAPRPSHESGGSETVEERVAGFAVIVSPLIERGRNRLETSVNQLVSGARHAPFTPEVVEDLLLPSLLMRLEKMLQRTMVLELNVTRLQGLLVGDTPEERFDSFVERLRRREIALEILREYPVLARQLVECVNQWVITSSEFLYRLCTDWSEVRSTFCPLKDPGELVHLDSGAGDAHRGGRSVYIATFRSGFRLVYKPRSLAAEGHFQDLLVWLNERKARLPFRALTVLDRNTHGWVEHVEAHPCASLQEIRCFYERQGGYLALLYALHATDFHSENLIAAGEHPVLVDLEALFHPNTLEETNQSSSLAAVTLNRSVLGVGLLPQRIWSNDEHKEGLDISGIGGTSGQLSPFRIPYWQAPATDEMRLARKQLKLPGKDNRPALGDAEVDVFGHVDEVIRGFSEVYQLLVEHRVELMADGGPFACFYGDEVRYVPRETQVYGMHLEESFHPDLLRDALDRDRFFDTLWVSRRDGSKLVHAFPYERDDLLKGDIPAFVSRPDSRNLWSSSGNCISDYLSDSGLAQARQRMQDLEDEDLAKQIWFIRASFTALVLGEGREKWPSHGELASEEAADAAQLMEAACKVGDRLEFLALHDSQDVGWLGLELINDRAWHLVPARVDLYNGLSGIALFLAYLGALSGQKRYSVLAESAVGTIRRVWEQARSSSASDFFEGVRSQAGVFEELGGTVYALTHLGVLWNRSELLIEAEALAEILPLLVKKDGKFDVISGASGCINVLLGLNNSRPTSRALKLATECGDQLIAQAVRMDNGIGWITPMGPKPLTGFAHGAAGVAHSLLELSAATGQHRFRVAALEAIAYERSLYCADAANWPDLRDAGWRGDPVDEGNQFMTTWCYGAPGVGLSRLRALEYLDDPELHREISMALETTLTRGLSLNHSLCHGVLGNLELPLEAGRYFCDAPLVSRVYQLAASVLASIERHGWLCGVPSGVETPGLMTGLAGIGYGLLRLAEPNRVPSVLLAEAPRSHDS